MSKDKTKDLLQQILANLYTEQTKKPVNNCTNYIKGSDGQYLGEIVNNKFLQNSLINKYGPFGSPYSGTSIFNSYSMYGSVYGAYSLNNPYCANPPSLFLNGVFKCYISSNPYTSNKVSPAAFIYTLNNDINALLRGEFIGSDVEVLKQQKASFLVSGDGKFLGKLNPNQYDKDSIFNQYGPYGSKYSQTSIFNSYSTYGNQFNSLSPYNNFSSNPPKIFINGQFHAYLSINTSMTPRIEPDDLLDWAGSNIAKY